MNVLKAIVRSLNSVQTTAQDHAFVRYEVEKHYAYVLLRNGM